MLNEFKRYYKQNEKQLLSFYFDLLRIPSISTDPKHQQDCKKAAVYVDTFLKNLGFKTELHTENRNYLVFAEKIVNQNLPTLMFYGHTDVQPCDPLDLWDHPPFDPLIKEGQVYARGAQDNKGQLAYTLLAIEAFYRMNPDPRVNLKLVIEGEEESGSHGTEIILKKMAKKLVCDELYVVDFDAKSKSRPSIVLGMRGLCAFEFTISNSSIDLHSGMYGGVVYNPLRAISEMLASCFSKDGLLAFDGAYNELKSLSKDDLDVIDFSFNQEHLEKAFDIKAFSVPKDVLPRKANWLMPTFEINGLFGGYTEAGVKTVLPKQASAKISCRLGPGQNPKHFIDSCYNHLKKSLPHGFKMDFKIHQAAGSFYTSIKNSAVQKAKTSLEEVFQHEAWVGLSGASVPIVGLLSQLATNNVALLGLGLDTDNIHAPNEHFSLDRFEKGFYSILHILNSTKDAI